MNHYIKEFLIREYKRLYSLNKLCVVSDPGGTRGSLGLGRNIGGWRRPRGQVQRLRVQTRGRGGGWRGRWSLPRQRHLEVRVLGD